MSQEIIITRRGVYGRVQIVLPLTVKTALLATAEQTGMSKAEFLQKALLLGATQITKDHNNQECGA